MPCNEILVLLIMVTTTLALNADDTITCGRGFYLYHSTEGPMCLMCPAATFMDQDIHQHEKCIPCTESNVFSNEVTYQPCSAEIDTVIGCRKGYFLQEFRNDAQNRQKVGQCHRCTSCEAWGFYEVRPCGTNRDTVCCPEPNMVVVDKGQGPECVRENPQGFSLIFFRELVGRIKSRAERYTSELSAVRYQWNLLP